jgi:hypothetical protein
MPVLNERVRLDEGRRPDHDVIVSAYTNAEIFGDSRRTRRSATEFHT